LGYETAGAVLKERLPRRPTARSGELAEILATEFTEAKLDFNVPGSLKSTPGFELREGKSQQIRNRCVSGPSLLVRRKEEVQ
jgi:hypothetical protein